MDRLFHDLRYSARTLLRTPGFTLVAVLTLALGIGVNTTIFSVVYHVLMKPLPVEAPERLVHIWETNTKRNIPQAGASVRNFADWRTQNRTFEAMAGYQWRNYTLTGGDDSVLASSLEVSAELLSMLGLTPALGRSFTQQEEEPGSHRVVLLKHGLWQQRFGADPAIIGRDILLDDTPYTVIGVLPADMEFPTASADLWTPLAFDTNRLTLDQQVAHNLKLVGRLRTGISVEQAYQDMARLARQTYRQYPESYPPDHGWGVIVTPITEQIVGPIRPALLLLFGAVTCVLLIACTNLTNLMLARSAARRMDVAVRLALGARRSHLLRQWLTESLLLSLGGGLGGLLITVWGLDILKAWNPGYIPRMYSVSIDVWTIGFTLFLTFITGASLGLLSAVRSPHVDLRSRLAGHSRGTANAASTRLRSTLIISEVALSLILLVGAGLLIRSLMNLQQTDVGFNPDRLMTMRIYLPTEKYDETIRQTTFFEQTVEQMQTIPGVTSVGGVSYLPFAGSQTSAQFDIAGREIAPSETRPQANVFAVTAGYFETMGMSVRMGRGFARFDAADAPQTVVINETLARRYWPDENPVGQRMTYYWDRAITCEIVGVVNDVRHRNLDAPPPPAFYRPHQQHPTSFMGLAARVDAVTSDLNGTLRQAVRHIDPSQPVIDMQLMTQRLSRSLARQRFTALLLGIFAGTALILAVIGLYGVMTYLIGQRNREIGIRMALGAQRNDVLALVAGGSMRMAGIGISIGLAGAFGLTQFLSGLLYGVSPLDPITLISAVGLLGGAALFAGYWPVRKAAQIDPVIALKDEG